MTRTDETPASAVQQVAAMNQQVTNAITASPPSARGTIPLVSVSSSSEETSR